MKENTAADDVWYEIFLRLPLDSIFRSKCVNKVWLSTLSCPNFISKWYKLNNSSLLWFLVRYEVPVEENNNRLSRNFAIAYPDSHSQFVENHQNGFSLSFLNPDFPNGNNETEEEEEEEEEKKNLFLMSSSNGLVLCRIKLPNQTTYYYVCNPLTQKWVSIPPPPTTQMNFLGAGLLCNHDESFSSSLNSTSFKVIRIPKFQATVTEFKVEIFSSELGEWNVYDVSCAQHVSWNLSSYDNLVTHNGVFYWSQKVNRRILAVCVSESNNNNGTCCNECRLIDIPDGAVGVHFGSHHCLGESEGLICYAMVNAKEKSLSAWVLEEEVWCLLYKDNQFRDMLAGMESVLIGEMGKIDLTQVRILGFNPIDKNVVILGYDADDCIWAYNTRTKGYEQLSHPSFLRTKGSARLSFLTFALKPWPTLLPPVSW